MGVKYNSPFIKHTFDTLSNEEFITAKLTT